MSPEQVMIAETVEAIKRLLVRKPPIVQGAILAELLALWLAGHFAHGDAAATQQLRDEVLALHLKMVRELVPINAKILGTDGESDE